MNSLFCVTERRNVRIKGRVLANRRKETPWNNKEEMPDPKVIRMSVVLSAVIHAKEKREVAVLNRPDAFIQTKNDKKPHNDNQIVNMEIDPETHGPHLTNKNGVLAFCLDILNALHCME